MLAQVMARSAVAMGRRWHAKNLSTDDIAGVASKSRHAITLASLSGTYDSHAVWPRRPHAEACLLVQGAIGNRNVTKPTCHTQDGPECSHARERLQDKLAIRWDSGWQAAGERSCCDEPNAKSNR